MKTGHRAATRASVSSQLAVLLYLLPLSHSFFFFLLEMNKHIYMGRVRDVGRGKGEGDGDVR